MLTPEQLARVVEAHRQALREAGFKPNPWRIGREMGRAYHATFWSWSDLARASRDFSNRPEPPPCPYSNPLSRRQWEAGYRLEATKPRPTRA